MGRHGDNIRKRVDGRWEGRYQIGRHENGTIKYRSVYAKGYFECKRKLENAKKLNFPIPKKRGREQTFGEVLNMWLATNRVRIKESTESKYRYMIDLHIMPALGKTKISSLDSATVNSFLNLKLQCGKNDGESGLAPSYVRTLAIIINSALQFASDEGICPSMKYRINKPQIEKKDAKILPRDSLKCFGEKLICDVNGIKLGVYIALVTGMRIGEICALKWENIDLKNKVIRVRSTISAHKSDSSKSFVCSVDRPKTQASNRDIPICSQLYKTLKKQGKKDGEFYVVSDSTKFMSTASFNYRYHKFLKENGLPDINFHALRHTFATRCVEVGVDIKTLSEILGHSDVSTTLNTYVHSSMEQKRSQLEKLIAG